MDVIASQLVDGEDTDQEPDVGRTKGSPTRLGESPAGEASEVAGISLGSRACEDGVFCVTDTSYRSEEVGNRTEDLEAEQRLRTLSEPQKANKTKYANENMDLAQAEVASDVNETNFDDPGTGTSDEDKKLCRIRSERHFTKIKGKSGGGEQGQCSVPCAGIPNPQRLESEERLRVRTKSKALNKEALAANHLSSEDSASEKSNCSDQLDHVTPKRKATFAKKQNGLRHR